MRVCAKQTLKLSITLSISFQRKSFNENWLRKSVYISKVFQCFVHFIWENMQISSNQSIRCHYTKQTCTHAICTHLVGCYLFTIFCISTSEPNKLHSLSINHYPYSIRISLSLFLSAKMYYFIHISWVTQNLAKVFAEKLDGNSNAWWNYVNVM